MELQPKKSLGQHFLNSAHALEQIVSAAQIQKGEAVLEIGPGTGILTKGLLDAGAKVVAIEKDERAFGFLKGMFSREIDEGRIQIVQGDILDENILAQTHLSKLPSFALVANIPYYITGAILEKFLEHGPRPDRMVLLVQKEVAERIVARDEKESILSISVKAFGVPKIVAKVPRGAFTPPPNVDSAILAIENISDARFTEKKIVPSRFFEFVRAGFAHKRKYLIRNLETVIPPQKLEEIWQKIGLDKKIRPENLKIESWFDIVESQK
jgi:16S rRNA (adenine1518-N6/adenine1519-N6)-dimethyltransferase